MSEQVAALRASIGSVLYRKSAFDEWADKKFNKMCDRITKVIDNYLLVVAEEVVEAARELLESASPSGHQYLIVDENGEVIGDWKASAPGEPPASLTELLKRSIEYRISSGGDRADYFEVGVWSDELWEFKTLAYYKLDPEKDEESEEGKYWGKLVVGEEGHEYPVRLYALALEEGFVSKKGGPVEPRPFLKPAFEKIVIERRKDFQRQMKNEFAELFGKTVPVTFRIYVGKQFQKSSK